MSIIEEKGKIIKKTKLGKKTVLGNKTKEIKEQIIVVGNNINKELKENTASFLLKLIIKAYYLSIWKKKIKALKYYSRKTNKQRMNFKKLINEISQVIEQCKSKYFNEIYEKIDKLQIPQNIKHDKNFGTLNIVNKNILNKINFEYNKNKENNNLESNKNDIIKYMVPNYINIINEKKNNINLNDDKYVENYENYNYNNYEDKEKGPDYDNNFNEVEYKEDESINNYNLNKNSQNYIENEVEEDTYFQNEYDYNQDNANYNNNKEEEYYQEDNYYYNDPNYNNNEYNAENDYYYQNNIYNDNAYNQNNNNYYYNDEEPYQNENINYESINKVDFYKNVGNNVIISDIYVKPKVESSKYNYNNKNNYGYMNNSNNYRCNMNNSKRAFPFSTHNHVFYISK